MSERPFSAADRLSLCMIVRDEEAKLARCLASAAGWVSELVVVDTGSRDGTVAIAESFGARVLHVPWADDFSAARNVALEAATREWVLVLDADEELVVDDAVTLEAALRQTRFAGFSLRCHSLTDAGGLAVGSVFRLFRPAVPGMRYRGQIHEQLEAVADGHVETAMIEGVHLMHDGYTQSAVVAKGKLERNLKLSRSLSASRPEDPFAWFCLGNALAHRDVGEMQAAYAKALDLLEGGTTPGEPYVLRMLLDLLEAGAGRSPQAPLLDRGLRLFPDSPDLHYLRGQQRLAEHDFVTAAAAFERCLAPAAAAYFLVHDPAAVGYGARAYLAQAYLQLGRNAEGEVLLREALAAAPGPFLPACRPLGMLVMQRGEWAEAAGLLQAVVVQTPTDDEARRNLGWCLYKLERYEQAETCLQTLSERPDVQQLLGQVYLDWGRGESALGLLAACPLPTAGLALGWAHYVLGQGALAAEAWQRWMRAGAADWGTKDTLAMFLYVLQGGRRPSGEPERPAEPLRDMNLWFRLLLRYERFDDVQSAILRGPDLGDRLWCPLRRSWGITLVQEGFSDVGTRLLLEAQAAAPDEPEIYYWLGVSASEQRYGEEARSLWQACLRLAPGHPLATRGLAQLELEKESP